MINHFVVTFTVQELDGTLEPDFLKVIDRISATEFVDQANKLVEDRHKRPNLLAGRHDLALHQLQLFAHLILVT